jgi:hypothetical protein
VARATRHMAYGGAGGRRATARGFRAPARGRGQEARGWSLEGLGRGLGAGETKGAGDETKGAGDETKGGADETERGPGGLRRTRHVACGEAGAGELEGHVRLGTWPEGSADVRGSRATRDWARGPRGGMGGMRGGARRGGTSMFLTDSYLPEIMSAWLTGVVMHRSSRRSCPRT